MSSRLKTSAFCVHFIFLGLELWLSLQLTSIFRNGFRLRAPIRSLLEVCWSGTGCAEWQWVMWTYEHSFRATIFICMSRVSQGSEAQLTHEFVLADKKVHQWESIWPWLSCEVERCIMQDKLDPLLPKTVDTKCWPAGWWLDTTFFFVRLVDERQTNASNYP